MHRQVIVMQGVSGSGKSTLARKMRDAALSKFGEGSCEIVSADDFFFAADGSYNYDAAKIDDAHNACFIGFLRALVKPCVAVVIVDNTNTLAADCAPYLRAASAFGWKGRILRVECDPKVALSRNGGRAPAKVVEGQAGNLEYQRFPAYWTIQTVKAEDVPTMDLAKVVSDA